MSLIDQPEHCGGVREGWWGDACGCAGLYLYVNTHKQTQARARARTKSHRPNVHQENLYSVNPGSHPATSGPVALSTPSSTSSVAPSLANAPAPLVVFCGHTAAEAFKIAGISQRYSISL